MNNQMDVFVQKLLNAAQAAGIETAEVYYSSGSSFSAKAVKGAIDSYEVSDSAGLSLRGSVHGKMGYAATEAYDDDAIRQLVSGVLESAELNEAEDQDEIFAGEAEYPTLPKEENDLDQFSAEEKLKLALAIERAALDSDPRIAQTEGAQIATSSATVVLQNSLGLKLQREESYYAAYCLPIAKDGDSTATGFALSVGRKLAALDPEALGREAAEDTLGQLHAEPVPGGSYRVVLLNRAARSLLATFSSVFSAESAQQRMSLLAGREGERIAAETVTLMDDPLLPGAFGSSTFDDEGSATRTKAVIENGVLTTLLHNRRTAKKQGVQTTGNARRSNGLHVSPSNFFFKPGEKSLEQLLAEMGDGLLVTQVSGLHAGANPISGDFSLLSKGFVIRGGKKAEPVERVTIAGNFYQLLQQVRSVGSDLLFEGSTIGSPSLDVGEMPVSGK